MPISDFVAGTIVRVPFPYSGFSTVQRRPALVIAAPLPGTGPALLWVLMITSAENRGWDGDVSIGDHGAVGLPVASVVRTAKIATIESARADRIGQIDEGDLRTVQHAVHGRTG